ncbi:MAG: transglutaminase domain-containing protein [Lachnospiraceae bacterium]
MEKLMKKLTSALLVIVLCVSCIQVPVQAAVTPEQVNNPKLVTSFRSVEDFSPMRSVEYCDMSASGMSLTVSGRTRDSYVQYRIAVRTAASTKFLFPQESLGSFYGSHYFSKTLNFSTLENGDYFVSVRFNNTGNGKFPSEAQMRYVPLRKNDQGIFIKQYTAVEQENAAIQKSNTYLPEYYLDTSLSDMTFELRNGRIAADTDPKALTDTQQTTIRALAESIVGTETGNYQKLRRIHDYLAENLYYNVPYNRAQADEKYQMAENGLITLNPYELAVKLQDGEKISTVCSGFSALYAAMARSLGIPCRTVRGRSLTVPGDGWEGLSSDQLTTVTHVWNEAYVSGKWIIVDVTKDCSNDYTGTEYIRLADDIVRYSGFDPSAQAMAVGLLYTEYREKVYADLEVPTVTAITNPYEPITITWSAVEGTTGYKVYRSCGLGYYDEIAITTDTTYTDTGLAAGTKYYYKITAMDSNGIETRKSAYKSVVVTAIYPVEMVSASGEEGQATIQFRSLQGIDTYRIYRSTSLNGTYSLIDTITENEELITFDDQDELEYGRTYYYKVRGVKGADTQAPLSEPVSCKVGVPTPTITLISGRNRCVRLWWEGMEQVTDYHIYRATSATGEYKEIATVDGDTNFYQSGLLTTGKKYYYKITAEVADGTVSQLSNSKAVTVKPVETPVLRSVSVSKRVVTLRWQPTTDAVKYYVYRGKSKDGTFTKVATITGNSCVYKSGKLTVGNKYYWKVKAVTANGAVSDYSLHKAITVKGE